MSEPKPNDPGTGPNPFVAWILPFALFLILSPVESLEPLKPHYPWVYAAKIAIITGVCIAFRRSWPAWSTTGFPLAVGFGIVGLGVWLALSELGLERRLVEAVPALSFLNDERVSFNPWNEIANPVGAALFIAVRLFGLAIIVPIIEEVFWRGFLMRYLIEERFTSVPIGAYSTMSFALVTILFAAAHPEKLAAIAWGAGINLLCVRTGNLWACVLGHAVTNLLLGITILATGWWHLW